MKSLLHAGAAVQRELERRGWRFAFIGGVANFRWGTPRLTNDLDLTLLTGFGAEAQYTAHRRSQRFAEARARHQQIAKRGLREVL